MEQAKELQAAKALRTTQALPPWAAELMIERVLVLAPVPQDLEQAP
jgi:hypothetical protein